jgi:HEAT repeat protein
MNYLALLTAGLKADDPVVASDAARLLGELGDPAGADGLIQYVSTSQHHYKSAGLWALGLVGLKLQGAQRDAVVASLRKHVTNPNVHDDWYWYSCRGVRAAAALALLMMGDDAGVGYLRELAGKGDDVFFCWFGPALLRMKDTCAAVGELKGLLTAAALMDTGSHKTRRTEPGLMTMKSEVLGILGGEVATAALLEMMQFHSRYVRGQAALSLLESGKTAGNVKAVEQLAKKDKTDFALIKASLALALAGEEGHRKLILKAAGSAKDPFDRAVAVESLGLLRHAEDAAVVAKQLNHADAYLRQCVLEALERLDPVAAAKAAKKKLKDASPRVRLQAAKILAGVSDAKPVTSQKRGRK